VLLLPDDHRALLLPGGIAAEGAGREIPLTAASVASLSSDAVLAFLQHLYDEYLRIPQDGYSVWAHPDHRVPVDRAEKEIQSILYLPVRAYFKDYVVRQEDTTREGRADISVMPKGDLRALGSCVIELKVLKSRGYAAAWRDASPVTTLTNEDAIRDGIDQARCYRDDLACEFTVLACYDMRDADEGDAMLERFAEEAAQVGVICRRYYLYPNAKEGRRARPNSVGRRPERRDRARSGGADAGDGAGPAGRPEAPGAGGGRDAGDSESGD
jgi:hypothetical protein